MAVKFTLLYLLYLTLLSILFTNSLKPGKLTYSPVKIKTKIYLFIKFGQISKQNKEKN